MAFSEKKFLSLPETQQHKKLAEMLRKAYPIGEELQAYHQACDWLQLPPLTDTCPESLSNRYHHHLNLAQQQLKEHNLLPEIRKGDRSDGAAPLPIHIYLDHLRSAHNVGSILRTTEALRLGSVHFSAQTPFIHNKKVKDAAMGCEEWVDCHEKADLLQLPQPVIVLETSPSSIPVYDFNFPPSFTLVLGNEEYGVSEQALGLASALVEIPLKGRKNSLNVANAYAIVAAEIRRQLAK